MLQKQCSQVGTALITTKNYNQNEILRFLPKTLILDNLEKQDEILPFLTVPSWSVVNGSKVSAGFRRIGPLSKSSATESN
jgi:hypothetical protein